ncbi:MAG: hypothetical protein AAF827_00300 [Cyanobacteria bacterium P01_D01_bin.6]
MTQLRGWIGHSRRRLPRRFFRLSATAIASGNLASSDGNPPFEQIILDY